MIFKIEYNTKLERKAIWLIKRFCDFYNFLEKLVKHFNKGK